MKTALILVSAALLIFGAWAIHPGLAALVALLAYGAVDGLLSGNPKRKLDAEKQAIADRKALGYDT